jgi:Holliday junction resolvase RusA-like endonuclease
VGVTWKEAFFQLAMTPQPQGSARAFVVGKRAVITTDNAKLKDYRSALGWAASAVLGPGWTPLEQAIEVDVTFTLPRPKSASKKRRYPTTRPDVDKLARAVLDAMTGVVMRDDSLVTTLMVRKRYGALPLTTVRVRPDEEATDDRDA